MTLESKKRAEILKSIKKLVLANHINVARHRLRRMDRTRRWAYAGIAQPLTSLRLKQAYASYWRSSRPVIRSSTIRFRKNCFLSIRSMRACGTCA